jgi:hypothetical protein
MSLRSLLRSALSVIRRSYLHSFRLGEDLRKDEIYNPFVTEAVLRGALWPTQGRGAAVPGMWAPPPTQSPCPGGVTSREIRRARCSGKRGNTAQVRRRSSPLSVSGPKCLSARRVAELSDVFLPELAVIHAVQAESSHWAEVIQVLHHASSAVHAEVCDAFVFIEQ